MEEFLKSGHTVKFANKEENEEFKKYNAGCFQNGAVRVHPENLVLPVQFVEVADHVYNYEFRQGDVLVQGYPKTGTTWTQEIVWTMLHNPDLNNPIANEQEIITRSPVVENGSYIRMEYYLKDKKFKQNLEKSYPNICLNTPADWFELHKHIPSPRVMKCHLLPSLFKANVLDIAKCIYLIRDPRDACLSFYHISKKLSMFYYDGTLDDYATAYLTDKGILGDYANHIRQFLRYKGHKNVHYIFYEDLKLNTMSELRKLNKFLETNLSDNQLENVKNETTIDHMKKQDWFMNRTSSNLFIENAENRASFFRKGIVGDHKNEFSEKTEQKFLDYIRENFKGMNLPYY